MSEHTFGGWSYHEIEMISGVCEPSCDRPPPHVTKDWRPDPKTGELKPAAPPEPLG